MNNNRDGFVQTFLIFTKALFFISITVVMMTIGYLLWSNPLLNENLNKRLAEQKQLEVDQTIEDFTEWTYDNFSDVATDSDKYPIVVLRAGYKVIKPGSQQSLVGWRYDVANTSPSTTYEVDVDYKLVDKDSFKIESSSGDIWINPESHDTIYGTMYISNTDLDRLSTSPDWAIRLSPNWITSEKDTQGTRYERLEAMSGTALSYGIKVQADNQFLTISDKWLAIQNGLGIEFEKNDITWD